jgi:hypothetical protein
MQLRQQQADLRRVDRRLAPALVAAVLLGQDRERQADFIAGCDGFSTAWRAPACRPHRAAHRRQGPGPRRGRRRPALVKAGGTAGFLQSAA